MLLGTVRCRSFRTLCLTAALVAVVPCALAAEVSGRVTDPDGRAVAGARVTLIELGRSVFTDTAGHYTFEAVPDGAYHLQALRAGLGSAVAELVLEGEASVDLALNFSVHREKIVVSSNRSGVGTHESVQPVTVLEKDELLTDMEPTLGEIVARQPGVSSTFYGAGASRPVVRGQQGSRVKLLESGLDTGDASSTSPDHAVSADPFEAERIEILRGPAVLLYGSSATGGAINVIDDRVPEYVPARKLGGELNLRHGSVAGENAGNLKLRGGAGAMAWQLQGFTRDAGDYDIPGRIDPSDPASPDGRVPNSFVESTGGSAGVAWIGTAAFAGVAIKGLATDYGVPPSDPDERVAISLDQTRYDARAGLNFSGGAVRGLRLQLGATDYEHVEMEGADPGTSFFNEAYEARFELLHGRGDWRGVVGLQAAERDFEPIGFEAFVPPSVTDNLALFTLQELQRGEVRYELGLRLDRQENSADGRPDRDFEGISTSAGVAWSFAPSTTISGSVSRTTRLPVAEELYSDGPHAATFSYEIGDADLGDESGLGLELGFRHTAGKVTTSVDLFYTDYDDYVFDAPTGEVRDDLPVFRFGQADAEFFGYEARVVFGLVHDGSTDLDLSLTTDAVRAELSDGSPLPFIPPRSHRLALDYRHGGWKAGFGIQAVESQDRIAAFETPTDSYTLVDLSVGYTLARKGLIHQFTLRGRNLTDEDARVHASRLKALAPLPGRDASFAYRLVF